MINKRLIGMMKGSKKYIAGNVMFQWIALAANIMVMAAVAKLLQDVFYHTAGKTQLLWTAVLAGVGIAVRMVCTVFSGKMGYLSSKAVKKTLRQKIMQKLLKLGTAYKEEVNTSEMVQVAVEGVDQLETYFGAYLPQFFYALFAPLTLFVVLSFVNLPSAVVLLMGVPLIPVTIILIQKWAKKLLSKYWGEYSALGDTFLENLQGLTTTKIYQTDGYKHQEMNEQSERFRKITMKVLTMQLNSITVMDLIAYGGAALGMILATVQFQKGQVDLYGSLLIILLAADFFLPMRLLGSYFHIAMNGMAASDKIFRLLDLPEPDGGKIPFPEDCSIACQNLCFSYEKDREVLHDVTLNFPKGSFTAIVGASGSGKSTIASLLTGRHRNYSGEITVGQQALADLNEESLMAKLTYVSHQSHLFKGSVRENLLMAAPGADDAMLWQVLEQVKLADFLRNENGLETILNENASNLSGGQCQRLALARALLHDSPVYIFDEATSNIDVESENEIMDQIHRLAKTRTVILISHRLANVTDADCIYVIEGGKIAEEGSHAALLAQQGVYAQLWRAQQELEDYVKGDVA